PTSPARLRPGLPRDLETICLKCLRKEPARRYESAFALAEDLWRFTAGEPIRARPIHIWERVWRWCRREPALAALAAMPGAGCIAALAQWSGAERHLKREIAARGALQIAHARELTATGLEARARRRAQERFQLGMKAIDGYSTLASEDELLKDPRLGGLRK